MDWIMQRRLRLVWNMNRLRRKVEFHVGCRSGDCGGERDVG